MNRCRKLVLSSTAVATLLALLPNEASASYICETSYISDKDFGAYGYLYVTLYDQPDCGGNYQGFRVWCSTNPTSGYCASDPIDLAPTTTVLLEAWKIAIEAVHNDEQVYAVTAGTYAFKGLTIYAY